MSEWMESNKLICLQFWYHMFGTHIGRLNVYLATKNSEKVTWSQSGNRGDRWMFAQISMTAKHAFKFILEGVALEGSNGDIAVDDITVLEEGCHVISRGKSPHCYFDDGVCNWEVNKRWQWKQSKPEKKGGYLTFMLDGGKSRGTLVSPSFSGAEWKCMRFWFRIGIGHKAEIGLSINSSNTTQQLWKSTHRTSKWSFVQVSINTSGTAKVIIEGISSGTAMYFDDVSFNSEPCSEMPWAPHREFLPPLLPRCLRPLGMQDGRIHNSAISASSYYRQRSAPSRGRLHLALPDPVVTGGWCEHPNQSYQWLQVDFGYVASVGKVATQGKQEHDFWVTKYFLDYRRDVNSSLRRYRQNGKDKIFDGNFDRHTVVSHLLVPRITAQFVRIYPYRHSQFGCLRVEYYGCAADPADEPPETPCYSPLGMQNGQIPNASITASSNFGFAHRARLHIVKEGGKPGAWVAGFSDVNQWLQVDFGALVMIRGLSTQGRHEAAEWVSSFVLSFSSVGSNFQFYRVNSILKLFTGNSNQHTVTVNVINPHILSRYLRIHPRTWFKKVALRIEIFGCLAVNMEIKDIKDMGCYKDTPNRAIPLLEAVSPLLDGSYMQRAAAIRRCAKTAYDLNLDTFALQNGGQCLGEPQAKATYNKYGSSTYCSENGRGGPWANQVYRIIKKCNLSDEWCDWISQADGTARWNIRGAVGLYRAAVRADANWGSQRDRRFVLEARAYKCLHVTVSVSSKEQITALTVCYWLEDNNATLSVIYTPADNKPAFSLLQNLTGLGLTVLENSVLSNVTVDKPIWLHLCVSWSSQGGIWKIYKNGRLFDFDRSLGYGQTIPGTGAVSISFHQNNELLRSRLSGLNIWDYEVTADQVYRLSLGCGDETGTLLQWFGLRSDAGLTGHVSKLEGPSCTYRDGVMSVVSNNSDGEAVLESPLYNRSADRYGMCLQFRFSMFGAGAKTMEIYQDVNGTESRIWKHSNNTIPHWMYGQVSFTSVTKSKVIVKGILAGLPGYIAIGGLAWAEGYCDVEPLAADIEACSEDHVTSSGFIFSPYHPGYYPANSHCNWLVTAPVSNVVRLEVLDFQLESNPRCANDFLEILDGDKLSAPNLGRFCGEQIPGVIESSGHTMLITFKSDKDVQRTGFKLRHSFREQTEDKICADKRDCPSGCTCFKISDIPKRFAIQGHNLRALPKSMPSYTTTLLFANNRISQIQERALSKLLHIEYIDLSHNVLLVLADYSFHDRKELKSIKLTGNFIRKLSPVVFSGLDSLQLLDLGENLLSVIPKGAFTDVPSLLVLSLRSNEIKSLEKGMFSQRSNLTYLYLQDNLIESIPDRLFKGLRNLKVLYLNNNKIRRISMSTFEGLSSLEIMYLDNNKIVDFSPETFHVLGNLRRLKMDHFTHCCYAVKAIPHVNCHAPTDGFSSCDDLMKNRTLQVFIWILGILAFLGNIFVVAWRRFVKEDNRIHSFLLTNLAISDFFMGFYLLIIAIKDVQWQGEYFKRDYSWRTGQMCQFAGVLSMVSSEVSVAMLTIITADRLVCIVFPFRFKRLSLKRVYILCALVWVLGIVISTVPLMGITYFTDKDNGFGFYGRSAVCLPLQLSSDRPAGWEYSVSFFIAFNFLAFTFMLVAYIAMFITAKQVGGAVRSTSVRRDTSIAAKMMFIILTDFFCWMPVIIIGVLSLTGNLYDPKQLVYVWIAVFVLPVNSSINPLLYTFSTTTTRKKLKSIRGIVSTFISRNMPQSPERRTRLDQSDGRLDIALSSMAPNTFDDKHSPGNINLKIAETCNIFHKHHSAQSIGYFTCWVESVILEMCLLKHFPRSKEKDWVREVQVLSEIYKHGEHPNLMTYLWHSEACALNIDVQTSKMPSLKNNGLLICFSFVSSTTLEEFLKECAGISDKGLKGLLSVMADVTKAIEHLHKIGVCHNNVSPSSVLISFSEGVLPMKGVLGNFGQAFSLENNDNWCLMIKEDLKQFGKLMEAVVSHCSLGQAMAIEVRQMLEECNNDEGEKDATYLRKRLQEICLFLGENTRL